MIKGISKFISNNGNKFNASMHQFPDIKYNSIATQLDLIESGRRDGECNFPPSDSNSMSVTEYNVIDSVRRLRTAALNNFELEFESYNARISAVQDEKEHVELLVGQSKSEIISITRNWENRLERLRGLVFDHQIKVKDFKEKNNIEGPPQTSKDLWLTVGLVLIMLVLETFINGIFFAEGSPMGLLGGMGLAVSISIVNVGSSMIFGSFARFKNINRLLAKLWGWILIIAFIIIAISLNLSVAHLRDALEAYPWDVALIEAIINVKENTFEVKSISSWVVIGLGAIISFISFWKGYSFSDPYYGYNSIWQESEKSIENYAEKYDIAHNELSEHFEEATKALRDEVSRRRDNMKSAEDALIARSSLIRNLSVFLESCNEGVNKLLRLYRDTNIKARKNPMPSYFDSSYKFENYNIPKLNDQENQLSSSAEKEVQRIKKAVEKGVIELLQARENALSAFPTVKQIKYSNTGHSGLMQNFLDETPNEIQRDSKQREPL